MSHTWESHVTHMNQSCHTHEFVMPHTWISHVTHMNQSCHTHEWVMSHTWVGMFYMTYMSHVTRVFESRHAYEWVTSPIFMSCHTKSRHRAWTITSRVWSHVTHMRESCRTHTSESCYTYRVLSHIKRSPCHTYEWVLSHIFMSCLHEKMPLDPDNYLSRVKSCHTYECVMSHIWMSNVMLHEKSSSDPDN